MTSAFLQEWKQKIGLLMGAAFIFTAPYLTAQSTLSPNSGINPADTYCIADVTLQSQATLGITDPINNSTSVPINPADKHYHIEAGFDANDQIVLNMYPTDAITDPTTTLADGISRIQVSNGGQMVLYDQSNNVLPVVLPPNAPAFQPLAFLGLAPGPSVLKYMSIADPQQLASATGGSVRTVQSIAPMVEQLTLPVRASGGGTMVMSYQNAGTVWNLTQMTVTSSGPNIQTTWTVQLSNFTSNSNPAGDARRSATASTSVAPPAASTLTFAQPALNTADASAAQTTNSPGFIGQNVLFQHGIFSGPTTWNRMVPWLTSSFQFEPFTDQLPSTAPLADQASTLINLISQNGLDDFIIVGHSQGGLIARDVAQRRPDLALGVITIDSPNTGALIVQNGSRAIADALANEINNLLGAAGCTSFFDNAGCFLGGVLANESFPVVNFARNAAFPATGDLVPGSPYLQTLNSTPENFTRVGIQSSSKKRWVLMRLGGDFVCFPDASCGGRAIAGFTQSTYDGLLSCTVLSILFGDFDTAAFCGRIASSMDHIDKFWDDVTAPGDASDGVVQGRSQNYAGATANYPINDADSHVGANGSDKVRDRISQAFDRQFFIPRTGCVYSISPAASSFPAAGGAISIAVNTAAGCAWSEDDDVPWTSVTGAVNGTGPGTVSLVVAPNSSVARSGSFVIAGQTFTVTQDGALDFSLSASPASQTVLAGGSASYAVSLSPINGFNAGIALSVTGLPAGMTASFNPAVINGSGVSTLTVTTSTSTAAGNLTLTVTGTSGNISHSATIALAVTNFSLSSTPAAQTVIAGGNTGYTLSVSSLNGFGGNVALGVTGLPAGATASFSPSSILGAGSSTLTITTSPSTPAANSTLTITATSGSTVHSTTVALAVTDFSLSATPASQTVIAGGNTSSTFSVSPLNGFNGSVALSVTGLPTGATASFNPASVIGSGSSLLTITTSSSTPAGNFVLTVTGTSGSASHSATFGLAVTDFGLTLSPASQNLTAGGSTSYALSVSPANGFSGTVALGVTGLPAGATATFSPNSILGSGPSTLTINTTGSTPAGNFVLTVTGTSGHASHSATVTLAVAGFSLSSTPASRSVTAGAGASYTVSVASLNGFSGTVALSVTGLPAGATASFSPASVVGSGASTLTVATSNLTPATTSTLTVTATSGGVSHSTTVGLAVTDFSLSATPASQMAVVGGSTSYTLSIASLNSFAGSVALSVTGLPAGATASFNPASVVGSGASTLTITTSSSTPLSNFTLTVTATSGSISHSINLGLAVTDFTLSSAPATQSISAGGSTSYTLTVSPINGFTGTVSLSMASSPTVRAATLAPALISGSGSSTLTIATFNPTPAGSFTLTITGTVGGLSHSTTVGLVIVPPPNVGGVSPAAGAAGTPVTITGTNFGASQGTGSVTFSGKAATIVSWSATSIVANVPSGIASGNVVVTQANQSSNAVSFTVIPPNVSLSPTIGSVGANVTISGTNFGAAQGTGSVAFGAATASIVSWSDTAIVASVPSGAPSGTVNVTVTTAFGIVTNGVPFTVKPRLGQTTSDVIAAFGQPQTIMFVSPNVTYFYPNMKVIFQNNVVVDVQ